MVGVINNQHRPQNEGSNETIESSETNKTSSGFIPYIDVIANAAQLLAGPLVEPVPAHLPHNLIHQGPQRRQSLRARMGRSLPNLEQ